MNDCIWYDLSCEGKDCCECELNIDFEKELAEIEAMQTKQIGVNDADNN